MCPDSYRVVFPQMYVKKDSDTSDTEALPVLWRGLYFFIVPNRFLCTYAANDDTMIVLYPCGITARNMFLMPVCVSNVHHLSRLSDLLVTVDL